MEILTKEYKKEIYEFMKIKIIKKNKDKIIIKI